MHYYFQKIIIGDDDGDNDDVMIIFLYCCIRAYCTVMYNIIMIVVACFPLRFGAGAK